MRTKKFTAILLVLMLTLALSVPAFGADAAAPMEGSGSDPVTVSEPLLSDDSEQSSPSPAYSGGDILTLSDLAVIAAEWYGVSESTGLLPDGSDDSTGDDSGSSGGAGGTDDGSDLATHEAAAFYLLTFSGLKESQLGTYPSDTNAMAKSVGLTEGFEFDAQAPLTFDTYQVMLKNSKALYDALHAETKEPLFVNGLAQPIFDYDEVLRYCVYVETNYDTDGDGKLDLVKAVVQLPRDVLDGMKVASIYEARPYIPGCTSGSTPYVDGGFDIASMYAQPEPRTAAGTATTSEAAMAAVESDYNYWNPAEWIWDYEDLDWYDYFLVRGYAVIESGGIGTKGSEGFETCGTDLEIDAFKCIIEWLTGDRVAYTDKTSNIEIKADWSNGNVGMTGRSYGGTTTFGLATTGVKGLKTIVPSAGIASWYEYTNSQGISTRSNTAYTEGLAFMCAGRYLDPADWATIAESYGRYLRQQQLDQKALNGDYGEHWRIRDYTLDAKNINCSALIVHGLNDSNVRTKQSDLMYDAFKQAGQNVKLLFHQGHHLTPTYQSPVSDDGTQGRRTDLYEMYIDDETYDDVLNQWFSHYLYDVKNGAEKMAGVTVQSNVDGSWRTYDKWESSTDLRLDCSKFTEDASTMINSSAKKAGITSGNFIPKFIESTTSYSAMYAMDVEKDTTIKGTIKVNIKAAPNNYALPADTPLAASLEDASDIGDADFDWNSIMKNGEIDWDAVREKGYDRDTVMMILRDAPTADNSAAEAAAVLSDADTPSPAAIGKGDALMMSAMLVDMSEEEFDTYRENNVPKVVTSPGGVWIGGGLPNYDLFEYGTQSVKYKVIAAGWMDLYNPNAGYDSKSAAQTDRVELEPGKYYDYTLYLQPNIYTVKEGHKLALVIYTYDPSKYSAPSDSQQYSITIDNSATYATIPLDTVKSSGGGSHGGGGGGGSSSTTTPPATDKPATDTAIDAPSFSDVASHWASADIKFVAERKLMNGTSKTEFSPEMSMTRGMFVTVLGNLAGIDSGKYTANRFTDVKSSMYYTPFIDWAAQNGIVTGTSASTFAPEQPITRQEMAVILANYCKAVKVELEKTKDAVEFADSANIASWAEDAIAQMQTAGILSGKTNNRFDPEGTATRAEVAAMIHSYVLSLEAKK